MENIGDCNCIGRLHQNLPFHVSNSIPLIRTTYVQRSFLRRVSISLSQIYTSSYDCTIRSLSFTSGVSRELYSSSDGVLITSIDLTPTGHEVWMSDSQGGATHLDIREDQRKARCYGLSDQKIGCISINPTRPHFLLTASNSRSLK